MNWYSNYKIGCCLKHLKAACCLKVNTLLIVSRIMKKSLKYERIAIINDLACNSCYLIITFRCSSEVVH